MKHRYPPESLGLNKASNLSLEQLFVQLCAYTTPYGSEAMLLHFFPEDIHMDEWGNLHYIVYEKDGEDPVVQFCSHMDSACSDVERVRMTRASNMIKTDGKTILSADCKIGVAIMLKMIEAGIPGWYVFHVGEEKGCVGAQALKGAVSEWPITPKISIEFDRHSYGSIITYQMGERCCSEEFSKSLAAQLRIPGYKPYSSDDGGLFTDNAEYMDIIPEVTNISVGYFRHHTHNEVQDIVYANHLLRALKRVKWSQLKVVRDPSVTDSQYSYGGHYFAKYGIDNRKGGDKDKGPFPVEADEDAEKNSWYAKGNLPPFGPNPSSKLPENPIIKDLGGGFHSVHCVSCGEDSFMTAAALEQPLKVCDACGKPLDQGTEDELEWMKTVQDDTHLGQRKDTA